LAKLLLIDCKQVLTTLIGIHTPFLRAIAALLPSLPARQSEQIRRRHPARGHRAKEPEFAWQPATCSCIWENIADTFGPQSNSIIDEHQADLLNYSCIHAQGVATRVWKNWRNSGQIYQCAPICCRQTVFIPMVFCILTLIP